MDPTRIIVYDRLDTYLCDVDPNQLLGVKSVEEINGEHSITLTTTQQLAKTNRLLVQDGRGYWHEYVITGIEESHLSATVTAKEYYAIWSLQYDLAATYVNNQYGAGVVPGHASVPVAVTVALGIALEGTGRWTVGATSVTTMASASFYRRSGWEAMQTVIERWGGELEASILVDSHGVYARRLNLLNHIGSSEASRRFDYGEDVTDIKRTVSDDIWPCRIIPLGKSQETEAGGYTRRPDISSVNGGVPWLEDSSVVSLVRVNGPNGYEYPTSIIQNDTYEAPADLKAWATEHITDFTRPKVSYSASVVQFVRAGLNPHGVSLGDLIYVVDRSFGDSELRLSARVVKIEEDLLDATKTKLTIGNILPSLAGQLDSIYYDLDGLSSMVSEGYQYQAGNSYMNNLLKRINDEVNATGGYTYITEGEGIRTYDVAVSDPLVGSEASMVVEIKGGTIRIANSKTSGGNWEWKTLLQSGFISADFILGGILTLGGFSNVNGKLIILDANGNQIGYWDKDGLIVGSTSGQHLKLQGSSIQALFGSSNMLKFASSVYAPGGGIINTDMALLIGEHNSGTPGVYEVLIGKYCQPHRYGLYSAAIGYGLYSPGYSDSIGWGGLACGHYNAIYTYGNQTYASCELLNLYTGVSLNGRSPLFVIGNGSSSTRRNALEVSGYGDLSIRGALFSDNVGKHLDSDSQSVTLPASGAETTVASVTLATDNTTQSVNGEVWIIVGYIDFGSYAAQGGSSADTYDNQVSIFMGSNRMVQDSGLGRYRTITCIGRKTTTNNMSAMLQVKIGANNDHKNRSVTGRIRAVRIV